MALPWVALLRKMSWFRLLRRAKRAQFVSKMDAESKALSAFAVLWQAFVAVDRLRIFCCAGHVPDNRDLIVRLVATQHVAFLHAVWKAVDGLVTEFHCLGRVIKRFDHAAGVIDESATACGYCRKMSRAKQGNTDRLCPYLRPVGQAVDLQPRRQSS